MNAKIFFALCLLIAVASADKCQRDLEFVAKFLKYVPSKDAKCEICISAVTEIEELFPEDTIDPDKITQAFSDVSKLAQNILTFISLCKLMFLFQFCDRLPFWNNGCHKLVDNHLNDLIVGILEQLEPVTVCTNLGICDEE